jgi:hypothetical protein
VGFTNVRGFAGPSGLAARSGLAGPSGRPARSGLAAPVGRAPFGVSDQWAFALPAGAGFFGVRRPPGFFGLALAQPGFLT